MTQMALDNSIRASAIALSCPQLSVHKLTVPDRDKRRLLRCLAEFEKALEGERLIKLTSIVLYVALLLGGLGQSYDIMRDSLTRSCA